MFKAEYQCPSCGGTLWKTDPTSRMIGCPYCGQNSLLNAGDIQKIGYQAPLVDYGSLIKINQRIKFQKLDLRVLGRLRMEFEDGFWDEWYIEISGMKDHTHGWLQEDDGTFTLFIEKKKITRPVVYKQIKVGKHSDLGGNWTPIFVTSKNKGKVFGGEGELPFAVEPGEEVFFIDGLDQGDLVSLEIMEDEKVLMKGIPLKWDEMVFQS